MLVLLSNSPYVKQPLIACAWIIHYRFEQNVRELHIYFSYAYNLTCAYTTFHLCKPADREMYRVQSAGADDDYYCSMWTAFTALQLSGNVENPWGKLTPTLNYRLALTAGLFAHQPANPPSHQPSLTLLPPFPLKTWTTCSSEPSPAPPRSFPLTFAI